MTNIADLSTNAFSFKTIARLFAAQSLLSLQFAYHFIFHLKVGSTGEITTEEGVLQMLQVNSIRMMLIFLTIHIKKYKMLSRETLSGPSTICTHETKSNFERSKAFYESVKEKKRKIDDYNLIENIRLNQSD